MASDQDQRTQSNPQIDAEDKQLEMVNQQGDTIDQADLAKPQSEADKIAAQRDDVDEEKTALPPEVTDQLLDGSDQIFLTAFKNAQADGMSREAALQVAWSSIKQGFERQSDGSWRRRQGPPDRVVSSGVGGSAS